MNPPNGEETIFAEALRLPAAERASFIARSTEGNAELRQRIEALLGSYDAGGFLEEAAAPELRGTIAANLPMTEKPGDTIGRYKMLQQIGEGGCGVVYMAEQNEPVRRRVALKIIRLGMDTKSVIARFEAERQALAMMDHPNIAKVFDAGATETGRPYFVMELVRGLKITDYCDEAKLSTRARLDLFIEVCQAIQHAHQKGIIHRDIKPSNILVTVNDGIAVPKVIDFGIAKATSGQQLTDKTLFTAFEQFIGTPAYMSPEQAVLTSLDIDTRSDIYALGVLLYELLTGKTPFDSKELLAIGLDEMRRTIREEEPARPSTRLSTLAQNELSTTAQRRGLDAPELVSELRGDLDWIVMKALEKDRARRYETANGLALDIRRHLNNEAVVACPPTNLYRFQKLVRRNKLVFAAGLTIATALIAGLSVSTWMFFNEKIALKRAVTAEREQARWRQEAEARARKAEAETAVYRNTFSNALRSDALLNFQCCGAQPVEFRVTAIGEILQLLGRDAELEQLFKEVSDFNFDDAPNRLQLLIGRAEFFAHYGRWQPAINDLKQAIQLRPDDHTLYHEVTPLLIAAGELDAYRSHCRTELEIFGKTEDPLIADRIAEDCLVLPSSGADLEIVAGLAKKAAAAVNHRDWGFFIFCKGLADYRRGDYAEAIGSCSAMLDGKIPSNPKYLRVQSYVVMAMAQQRSGLPELARETFRKAKELEAELPRLGTPRSHWNEWVLVQAFLKEAQSIVQR